MKLRPYHNPENVDESKVPDGWRFLYADEAGKQQERPCKAWLACSEYRRFSYNWYWAGTNIEATYIVLVNA